MAERAHDLGLGHAPAHGDAEVAGEFQGEGLGAGGGWDQHVGDLATRIYQVGELLLEVAPRAHLSDDQATDTLTRFCNDIGIDPDHALVARRYARTSDRRALHGTVL
ncbi:hypothetical protein ACFU98_47070 [Streptomyces sp. NPDC057575]|uniref:hypothetical protein n=1 Tax=unclassified Streptomyces TaxID=2593676 RepID=UPI0036AE7588